MIDIKYVGINDSGDVFFSTGPMWIDENGLVVWPANNGPNRLTSDVFEAEHDVIEMETVAQEIDHCGVYNYDAFCDRYLKEHDKRLPDAKI